MRIASFERRIVLAYRIQAGNVVILRILYGGRDIGKALDSSPAD